MTGPAPLSLAEIRFYVTRAVAGAGAPFGVGEEVAEATVRLAAAGKMNWALLAAALDRLGQGRSAPGAMSAEQPVSALVAGTAMAWLAPEGQLAAEIDDPKFTMMISDALLAGEEAVPPGGGVTPDPEAWAVIQRWFRECLVPSSAESRLSGAGAGLVETD